MIWPFFKKFEDKITNIKVFLAWWQSHLKVGDNGNYIWNDEANYWNYLSHNLISNYISLSKLATQTCCSCLSNRSWAYTCNACIIYSNKVKVKQNTDNLSSVFNDLIYIQELLQYLFKSFWLRMQTAGLLLLNLLNLIKNYHYFSHQSKIFNIWLSLKCHKTSLGDCLQISLLVIWKSNQATYLSSSPPKITRKC